MGVVLGLEDKIVLDRKKLFSENVRDVLVNVTKKDESVSATTKTGYVEALIRLLQQTDNDSKDREMGLRLRMREVMMCLRLPLTNDKEELRSSALKLVGYLVRSEKDVHAVTQVDKKNFVHILIQTFVR